MFVGVDPGLSGAVATLDPLSNGSFNVCAWDMPTFALTVAKKIRRRVDVRGLSDLLTALNTLGITAAAIEDLSGRPATVINRKGERVAQAGAWQQGFNAGLLVGAVAAIGAPYALVTPAVWKAALDVPSDKSHARRRASELMPSGAHLWQRAKDDGRAEAALLALFAYRRSRGLNS